MRIPRETTDDLVEITVTGTTQQVNRTVTHLEGTLPVETQSPPRRAYKTKGYVQIVLRIRLK